MADDDELERLLREVEASLSPGAPSAASKQGSAAAGGQVAKREPEPRGRVGTAVRTGGVAGLVCGAGVFGLTFLFQWLPLVDHPVSSGAGAFVGAFLTGAFLSVRGGGR